MKKIIFYILAVLLIAMIFFPSIKAMREKRDMIGEYEAQIKELEKKNAQLKEEMRLLEEDPVYLEKIAREKMGLVKEGEVIYKIEQ